LLLVNRIAPGILHCWLSCPLRRQPSPPPAVARWSEHSAVSRPVNQHGRPANSQHGQDQHCRRPFLTRSRLGPDSIARSCCYCLRRLTIMLAASPKLPKRRLRSARSAADFGIASSGSNGLARPRSLPVFGMNCAMPCAPAGLISLGRKLLSCQINRVRKATGKP
jgi:hypothetical protein